MLVHRPSSEVDAERVIRLLESHHIPALSSDRLGAGWAFEARVAPVVVPAALREAALDLLRRQRRPPPPAPSAPRPRPPTVGARPEPGGGAAPRTEPEPRPEPDPREPFEEAEPDRPIEPPEVVPTSHSWWLIVALLTIAGGIALQVSVDRWGGPRTAVELFGASARAWPQVERWITAGFVHGSSAHAIGNSLFGLIVGWATFHTHGVGSTAFVWLASSAFGIAAQTTLHPEAMVIGASAGNYGLVGLWARGQWERARRRALPRRERLRTFGVLLLLVPGAFTPFTSTGAPVAVTAHALGFCGGALAGLAFPRRLAPERVARVETRSMVAGWVAVGTTALAFVFALGRALFG